MRRFVGLLTLALAGLLPTAPAAVALPDRCPRASEGQRYVALAVSHQLRDRTIRSAVVLCDRRSGRERRVAEAEQRASGEGLRIDGASAYGTRLVWIEAATGAGRTTARLRVHDLRARRLTATRVVGRRTPSEVGALGVGAVADGSIAWLAHGTVRRARIGEPSHVVARGTMPTLDIEDGRTLRWLVGAPSEPIHAYVDLLPLPSRAGCPVRERFARSLSTPEILVTRAGYGSDPFMATGETRVCLRATGTDATLGARFGLGGQVAAQNGDWIFVVNRSFSRYSGCEWATVYAGNLRDGRVVRSRESVPCGEAPPEREAAIAVGSRGAAAWIGWDGVPRALRTDGSVAVLVGATADTLPAAAASLP